MRRDTLCVVPPGTPHGGQRIGSDPWVYLAIYPTAEFLEELFQDLTGNPAAKPNFSRLVYRDPEMVAAFVQAHRSFLSGEDALRGETALVRFLAVLLERYGEVRPRLRFLGGKRRAVDRAVDYIEEHLGERLDLAGIAAASGYSRFHFLRMFKDELGQTPVAFVMQRRVEHAKRLLRRGLPIADTAYRSGFADQAHLNRRFKQQVGVTPGEYVRGTS